MILTSHALSVLADGLFANPSTPHKGPPRDLAPLHRGPFITKHPVLLKVEEHIALSHVLTSTALILHADLAHDPARRRITGEVDGKDTVQCESLECES